MTSSEQYMLKIYVTSMTPKIENGIGNLQRACDNAVAGHCDITIVNILENPQLAEGDRILATPTLIKTEPPPIRRVIGDISSTDKVMKALGFKN